MVGRAWPRSYIIFLDQIARHEGAEGNGKGQLTIRASRAREEAEPSTSGLYQANRRMDRARRYARQRAGGGQNPPFLAVIGGGHPYDCITF